MQKILIILIKKIMKSIIIDINNNDLCFLINDLLFESRLIIKYKINYIKKISMSWKKLIKYESLVLIKKSGNKCMGYYT